MGILDDAIRQHLDLKRRQGADANELQRLEDEAFGLPARPGDPDFPADVEADELGELEGAAEEPETLLAEPGVEPAEAEAPAGLFDVESEEPFAEAAAPEAPVADQPPAEEEMPSAELEQAGAELDEEFDLEGIDLELEELEPGEPAPPAEPEELAEPEAFEPQDLREPEVDEEADAAAEVAEPPLEAAPEPEPAEPPIESLDTVEHHIEEAEPAEAEPPAEEVPPDAPEGEAPPAEEGEGEDVLEETPEFLRDRPEDDELWFEQGEPKDFDF